MHPARLGPLSITLLLLIGSLLFLVDGASAQSRSWIFIHPDSTTAVLDREGISVHRYSRLLHAASASLTEAQQTRLAEATWVTELRPVGRFTPQQSFAPLAEVPHRRLVATEDTLFGLSYEQLADINAITPLRNGINGTGVRVGFIDTAFRFDHPALSHLDATDRLIATTDFTADQPVQDTNQHGTAVASIAVGYAPGELVGPGWGAEVVAAHSEYAPTETHAEEDNLVASLEYMLDHEVDVVNISLGYLTFPDDTTGRDYTYADLDGNTAVTTRAVDAAVGQGLTVVVSAGNSGCSSPGSCFYYITTPADADSSITVGAVALDSTLASFSGRGPTVDGRTKPDVVAPGRGIRFAVGNGGFGTGNGTSFSAPLTTGVVAMLLQVNPSLTPIELRDLLTRTASRADQPDNHFGAGIINADLALTVATGLWEQATRPAQTRLAAPPYPNPANTYAFFLLDAQPAEAVSLRIFDLLGREVAAPLVDRTVSSPETLRVPVGNLSPGLYVYRFTTATTAESGTLVVIH